MNSIKLSVMLAVAAGFLAGATAQAQNVLVNGDFENEPLYGLNTPVSAANGGYTVMYLNAIPGWTIAPGHAATIHNTTIYPTIGGNYSLNTDGEGINGNNVLIYQDFSSTAGKTYNLGFQWETWLVGRGDLEVKVTDLTTSATLFDGIYLPNTPTQVPQTVSSSLVGTGDTLRLQIDENPQSGYNDNEFIVDNFTVSPSTVPETSAWFAEIIAAAALVGLSSRVRNRRA